MSEEPLEKNLLPPKDKMQKVYLKKVASTVCVCVCVGRAVFSRCGFRVFL